MSASHFAGPVSSSFRTLSLHDALPICLGGAVAPHLDARHRAARRPGIEARHDTGPSGRAVTRSEEHTSELQSRFDLVCRLLLEKKKSRMDPQKWTPKSGVCACGLQNSS